MSLSRVTQNECFLSSFELGGLVIDAYELAVEADPRLAAVNFVPYTLPGLVSMGASVPGWAPTAQEPGTHEIQLRLESKDAVFSRAKSLIKLDPTSHAIMADRMGISPELFNPAAYFAFAVLHELGHASQYYDWGTDYHRAWKDILLERSTLPYVYAPPSSIATPGTEVRKSIERRWDYTSFMARVATLSELVEAQATAYRNMPSEANADHFAVEVFDDNPAFVDLLVHEY